MQLETREFRAEGRFQRVSPQKARLVLDLIRGRRVGEALETVAFTRKGVAPLVEKVLRSAIQNANYLSQEEDLDVDVDNLYVKTAVANDGPRMKRVRPAPMGRAFRYQRRLSHIVIAVAERKREGLAQTIEPEEDRKPASAAPAGAKKVAKKKKTGAKKAGATRTRGAKAPAKKAPAKKAGKSPAKKPQKTEK
jgi:large subunit ribosomal protein L22